MVWSINSRTLHCHHPLGISLYYDPIHTESGAIRILGPWVPRDLPRHLVTDALSLILETFERDSSYVVFGSYEDKPSHSTYSFDVLGSKCGYIPSLATKLQIDPSLNRDWIDNKKTHRSGLSIDGFNFKVLDIAVLHPVTISADISCLFADEMSQKHKKTCEQNLTEHLRRAYAA